MNGLPSPVEKMFNEQRRCAHHEVNLLDNGLHGVTILREDLLERISLCSVGNFHQEDLSETARSDQPVDHQRLAIDGHHTAHKLIPCNIICCVVNGRRHSLRGFGEHFSL